MFGLGSHNTTDNSTPAVYLHLSGDMLRMALDRLIKASDAQGGLENYVMGLQLRHQLFCEALSLKNPVMPEVEVLQRLCTFMPTVRRRIAPYIEDNEKFAALKAAMMDLLDGAEDTTTTDARIQAFCETFPNDKSHRWVRDFAVELLHGVDPERYPLMTRWVWDGASNTGVIREIWYADNVDHQIIDVDDRFETFITLRQELSQYLSENGFYKDMLQYVDILKAQIYSNYICEHGGTYIRADFSNPEDPMMHIRRLLGLDGVSAKGRARVKTIDGNPIVFEDSKLLS